MDRGQTFFFNGWSQDIFFTHGQGPNIFFCQNQGRNIFFQKNPGPPWESNGRSLSWLKDSAFFCGNARTGTKVNCPWGAQIEGRAGVV